MQGTQEEAATRKSLSPQAQGHLGICPLGSPWRLSHLPSQLQKPCHLNCQMSLPKKLCMKLQLSMCHLMSSCQSSFWMRQEVYALAWEQSRYCCGFAHLSTQHVCVENFLSSYCTQRQLKLCVFPERSSQVCVLQKNFGKPWPSL